MNELYARSCQSGSRCRFYITGERLNKNQLFYRKRHSIFDLGPWFRHSHQICDGHRSWAFLLDWTIFIWQKWILSGGIARWDVYGFPAYRGADELKSSHNKFFSIGGRNMANLAHRSYHLRNRFLFATSPASRRLRGGQHGSGDRCFWRKFIALGAWHWSDGKVLVFRRIRLRRFLDT